MDFVAIDFETANQDRDSACEIAVCVVKNNEITECKSWLIRPPVLWFDPWNNSIHGLSEQDVADKPKFNKLWKELKPYFELMAGYIAGLVGGSYMGWKIRMLV